MEFTSENVKAHGCQEEATVCYFKRVRNCQSTKHTIT